MTLRERIEGLFETQVAELTASEEFRALESGTAAPADYDRFLADVVRTHLRATEYVAFLCALAPPATSESRLRNLLEELHHPGLLRQLAAGSGLGDRLPELEIQAAADVRRLVVEPVLYRTLGELGFAAFCEVVAFEYMLARLAGRIAAFLALHRGLGPAALRWWTEHADVDVQHAAEGLADLEIYARYYGLADEDGLAIAELTLRENVFLRRYFREGTLAALPAEAEGTPCGS
jgi:Iron-containing redox enzyme